MTTDLRKAIEALLNDVDAMRTLAGMTSDFDFGPFDDGETYNGETFFNWPNLSISAEKLREAFDVAKDEDD